MAAESQSVVIRPRRAKPSGRPAAATLIVGAGFGLSAVVRPLGMRSAGRSLTVLLLILAGGLVCWGVWLLYRTNASLRVEAGELVRTDALGRVTRIPLARVSRAVRQTVRLGSSGVRSPQLLFLAEDGRCLLRVYASQYDDTQLASLCAAAGIPLVGSWDEVATSKEVRRRYPGSYSWWLAHPWALSWTISIVAIVVGVAIATR